MDIDNLQLSVAVTALEDLTYPSVVSLIQCQGTKVDLWQVHSTERDARIYISDQGFTH
jgi:hypothetical protein